MKNFIFIFLLLFSYFNLFSQNVEVKVVDGNFEKNKKLDGVLHIYKKLHVDSMPAFGISSTYRTLTKPLEDGQYIFYVGPKAGFSEGIKHVVVNSSFQNSIKSEIFIYPKIEKIDSLFVTVYETHPDSLIDGVKITLGEGIDIPITKGKLRKKINKKLDDLEIEISESTGKYQTKKICKSNLLKDGYNYSINVSLERNHFEATMQTNFYENNKRISAPSEVTISFPDKNISGLTKGGIVSLEGLEEGYHPFEVSKVPEFIMEHKNFFFKVDKIGKNETTINFHKIQTDSLVITGKLDFDRPKGRSWRNPNVYINLFNKKDSVLVHLDENDVFTFKAPETAFNEDYSFQISVNHDDFSYVKINDKIGLGDLNNRTAEIDDIKLEREYGFLEKKLNYKTQKFGNIRVFIQEKNTSPFLEIKDEVILKEDEKTKNSMPIEFRSFMNFHRIRIEIKKNNKSKCKFGVFSFQEFSLLEKLEITKNCNCTSDD